jgi:molybdate transport system ATP-binding protein
MRLRVQVQAERGGREFSFRFESSNHMMLLGENGSGKTTALHLLMGLLPLRSSHVEVDGQLWHDRDRGEQMPVEARGIGYVSQSLALFPHWTGAENVQLGARRRSDLPTTQQRERGVVQLLERMQIDHLGARSVTSMSGGERQLIAIARAVIGQPRLLLLDEPLSALDARRRKETRRFLLDIMAELDCPTIWVTHDIRDVVAARCPVGVMEAGRMTYWGEWEELRQQPHSAFIEELAELQPPPS